ncbi:insulysin [Fusarium beomiforme]|uniref:Insulysin n=1 Tax=Fusarium beomiforme TaxID=44412 RepID=A0A9P5ARI7_9HYPO|nr:insulysin [Fusarium beomiforme]
MFGRYQSSLVLVLTPFITPAKVEKQCTSVAGNAPMPVTLATDSLEKPSLDDRDYRVIRLDNELEALLIHDPDTDKASGALDVNVGNFSDESDIPGMAHAVEHANAPIQSSNCDVVQTTD